MRKRVNYEGDDAISLIKDGLWTVDEKAKLQGVYVRIPGGGWTAIFDIRVVVYRDAQEPRSLFEMPEARGGEG